MFALALISCALVVTHAVGLMFIMRTLRREPAREVILRHVAGPTRADVSHRF